MNEKFLFILNPISGLRSNRRKKIRYEIVYQLRKKNINGEIRYSKYAGHAAIIAREAISEGYKYIVVAGGDGSIHEVAKELINTDVALGIIPTGSGNGFARSINIPFDIKKCLNIIKNKNVKKADVLKINEHYAISLAGIGFDAGVANKYSQSKVRGFITYFNSMVQEYFTFKPEKIKIISDELETELNVFCVVLANSNQFGYNFKIAPKATIFDGFIDVIIIKPFPLVTAPLSSLQIFMGHANKNLYISNFQTKKIQIIRNNNNLIQIDGDPIEIDDFVINVEIIEKALNIII